MAAGLRDSQHTPQDGPAVRVGHPAPHYARHIGHLQLAHLRAPDIQQLKAELLANGKATSSVRHVLVLLKEALKHALRWGLINVNVADAVDLPKLEQREIQPPSVEEVRDILALAKPPMA